MRRVGSDGRERQPRAIQEKSGADDPIRTDDLLITSELLYQLSYVGAGSQAGRESSCGFACAQHALGGQLRAPR